MLELFLIRHGETEWNKMKRIQGHCDIPLSDYGVQQGELAGNYLRGQNFSAIYSSDLLRAKKTAQLIGKYQQLDPIICSGLREIKMGLWEGLNWDQVGNIYPEQQQKWIENAVENGPQGGENLNKAHQRVWQSILEICNKEQQGLKAIVTHGLVIATCVCRLKGESIANWRFYSPENTSITRVKYHNNNLELIEFNRYDHLMNSSIHLPPLNQG